jgi:hypothetical protein
MEVATSNGVAVEEVHTFSSALSLVKGVATRRARHFDAKDGGSLAIWRQWAPHGHGQAMKGGHFVLEENPGDTAVELRTCRAGGSRGWRDGPIVARAKATT